MGFLLDIFKKIKIFFLDNLKERIKRAIEAFFKKGDKQEPPSVAGKQNGARVSKISTKGSSQIFVIENLNGGLNNAPPGDGKKKRS